MNKYQMQNRQKSEEVWQFLMNHCEEKEWLRDQSKKFMIRQEKSDQQLIHFILQNKRKIFAKQKNCLCLRFNSIQRQSTIMEKEKKGRVSLPTIKSPKQRITRCKTFTLPNINYKNENLNDFQLGPWE